MTQAFKLFRPGSISAVFIVNGAPRAGKDSLIEVMADLLFDQQITTSVFSSIDPIRNVLTELGIDVSKKTPQDRKLLADMGTLLEEHCSYRFIACMDHIAQISASPHVSGKAPYVFLHIREPEIIDKIRLVLSMFRIPVWRIQVQSNRAEVPTNSIDAGTGDMTYDYIVKNNGTLRDLECEAKALLNMVSMRTLPKDFTKPITMIEDPLYPKSKENL